jgi:acetyl-CoA C-acetyltransferase
VQEVLMGNVVSGGLGQAPARQAARGAGLPDTAVCTTVNKVCASGMKAVMLAAQSILLGHVDVAVAGGMESMSNAPFLLPPAARGAGLRLGHAALVDSVIRDGLWDPYSDIHMGSCAEKTAAERGIGRAAQDAFAAASYARARAAVAVHAAQIAPLAPPPVKRGAPPGAPIAADEEPPRGGDAAKMAALRPSFPMPPGVAGTPSITPANASKLNDGAAALVLMSGAAAAAAGVKPLARLRAFADAEGAPIDFSTAPAAAVAAAMARAGVTPRDCAAHEINEAFSSVALANMELLGLSHERVNVHGGAVALGHPIGASGARIVGALIDALRSRGGGVGTASVCNGGGGGSAVVLELL